MSPRCIFLADIFSFDTGTDLFIMQECLKVICTTLGVHLVDSHWPVYKKSLQHENNGKLNVNASAV